MVWIVVLLAIVVVALMALAGQRAERGGQVGYPYIPAKRLFSDAERTFLTVLDQAVGSDHRVFGKVRVGDVALVKPGLGRSASQGALNRIASKHFDYVVCRASDLSVVCAVELNDRSHGSKRAQARDELVAKVCGVIRLPLLTVTARPAYVVDEVRGSFLQLISPTT